METRALGGWEAISWGGLGRSACLHSFNYDLLIKECSEIVMWMCTLGGDNDVFPATCGGDPLPGLLDYCNQAFTPYAASAFNE